MTGTNCNVHIHNHNVPNLLKIKNFQSFSPTMNDEARQAVELRTGQHIIIPSETEMLPGCNINTHSNRRKLFCETTD